MALYCEKVVSLYTGTDSGPVTLIAEKTYLRVTKVGYTAAQISAGVTTGRMAYPNEYNANNQYLDFDNSGWPSPVPYYYGDPRTFSSYVSFQRLSPYTPFTAGAAGARRIYVVNSAGVGFDYAPTVSTDNPRFNKIRFEAISRQYTMGIVSFTTDTPTNWLAVGGLTISSDNIVMIWSVEQDGASTSRLKLIQCKASRSADIIAWLNALPDLHPVDPYEPGGYSGTGGGGGTFDLESDTIGLPPLPTLSFAATGFTRIYNPTLAELNSLANYLWTDQTFLDTVINHLKQLLENPMDAVISLSLLPCSIPNGSPEAVKVMYINTGVSMAPATTQFVDVDCGTYTIEEFYGSALDYNPYTKVHCYLPYIGQVTLDTDEVMGKTLNVVYRIDIVTGMCAAMILVDQNVLYQFSGHCAINMPINSADFSGYIGAAMTAGKMVAGVVAGASGNLPLAGELIGAPAPKVTSTSQTTETVKSRNPKTGRQVTQWSDTKARETTASGASFGEMTRKAISNSVGAVMGSKLTVEHAGGFTGNSGYLAVRRPYLIIERPRMCNPEEYGRYNGRPSMIYMNLGECAGYTEVQSIQFENIAATNPELAELSELLKSGVLF